MSWTSSAPYSAARSASCCYPTQWPCPSPQPARAPELLRRLAPSRPGPGPAGPCHPGDWPSAQAARPPAAPGWCRDVTRPAEHVTPEMLMHRCDSPLLLAATRCAIGLAEARGWSAATIAGVFYGLKAVLDGHTGEDVVLLSEVRERVRPRSHSSTTRIAEVLAELGMLHDDTTAAIRAWIDRRTGELPAGFGRDVRAWLVVLLDGDARTRPRSHATVHFHLGRVRPFIECWAATRGHLREITSSDVDTVLEPLRGHRRYNAITALRSLFRFAKRGSLTFADPTAHLRGGRAADRTMLPMTAEQIRAVQQAAATPAQRLAIAPGSRARHPPRGHPRAHPRGHRPAQPAHQHRRPLPAPRRAHPRRPAGLA